MLVLALDTATPAVTAGVVRLAATPASVPSSVPASAPASAPRSLATAAAETGQALLAERVTVDARAHGELLLPSVLAVLADAGVGMRDLDALVCGAGPGPFTGLRVGMVTAAALCDALDIPGYPVISLDAVAYRAGTGTPLLVATDARRREVYWARYDEKGDRVQGPQVGSPTEVPVTGVDRVAGAAAELFGLPVVGPAYPEPAALVALAAPAIRAQLPPDPLTPLYLRRPDALEPGARKRVTPA